MKFIVTVCLTAGIASSAIASNLGEALKQPVQLKYESPRRLFEVERCLILRDWGNDPNVYRTPDLPEESLIYFSTPIGRPMTIVLTAQQGKTVIEVRNNRGHFEPQFEACGSVP